MAVKCGGRCIWDKHIEYTAGIKHPYKTGNIAFTANITCFYRMLGNFYLYKMLRLGRPTPAAYLEIVEYSVHQTDRGDVSAPLSQF